DVRGKIVIARYGGSWRGIKPKVAAEKGAIGALIYSDPRDDGYAQGTPYPEGPWRPEDAVQRGSVLDLPVRPGDPLTPGYGATADAPRLSRDEAGTIMTIPVLPISYADAQPLLAALGGPAAPTSWRGALPVTYRLGPGPARVHLRLAFDWDLVPAYNVIARMTGSELPDEWIVRGNHRDGWAMGAHDPISGLVAMMAEARAVGELARTGWQPKRTLVYAAWDAEEPALLGSTEWAEHHADELQRHAVLYINTDSNGRGILEPGGSHTLERLINQVAADVDDPRAANVRERMRADRATNGDDADVLDREDLRISPLGSGSDWTPFLQHLGIASVMLSFGGEYGGGDYHSAYDTFDHFTRFIDPGFGWGTALARVAGRVTLRTAQADVVPLRFGNLADNIGTYIEEIVELADEMRTDTETHNRLVEEGLFVLASDPTQTYVPPAALDPVPEIDFAPLKDALARLTTAAEAYDSALVAQLARGPLPDARAGRLNAILRSAERTLTREEGLPQRPWYRHQVYAPGLYTGYGVKTLPGVREAIEQREWRALSEQIGFTAAALSRMADAIEQATQVVRGTA
ncbi:MAG: transferrin receptor-like dimerization domain-containing protein, partial [Longimicrobiales bacterium]